MKPKSGGPPALIQANAKYQVNTDTDSLGPTGKYAGKKWDRLLQRFDISFAHSLPAARATEIRRDNGEESSESLSSSSRSAGSKA